MLKGPQIPQLSCDSGGLIKTPSDVSNISLNGVGVILFGCDTEPGALYELVYFEEESEGKHFEWKKLPQTLTYPVKNLFYPMAIFVSDDNVECKKITSHPLYTTTTTTHSTTTSGGNLSIYLGISIPTGVILFIFVPILVIIIVKKRRKSHQILESVMKNIFDHRLHNQKLDEISQKMFDDEIFMLAKIDIDQITKGRQIGRLIRWTP